MIWFFALLAFVVAIVIIVLFLNRYYVKSSRDVALIRTGAGGRKVVVDGGAVGLPILHRVERVSMRSIRLRIDRSGPRALISEDRLRVDIGMEFQVRVNPDPAGIAVAAQVLGTKSFRDEDMQSLFEGKLIDAAQAEVALRTMDALHAGRSEFSEAVGKRLHGDLARSGLVVDFVSLVHLDQTPFASLDDTNAFNAIGMRRLAEVVAENRKARIDVEAEADIAVRKRQLEQTRDRLRFEREQQEYEITNRLEIERQRINSNTELEATRTQAERQSEALKISKVGEVKQAEIERDLTLRRHEMQALLEVEIAKIDNAIVLAAKRGEESIEQTKVEAVRTRLVEAQESVQTAKDIAAAERARKLAALKVAQENETDDAKVRSQVGTIIAVAKAESEAVQLRSYAERDRLVAEASGRQAQVEAENKQSEAVLRARVEMHKIDKLPEIATQMMKPVEKIESIRINHIGGMGNAGGADGSQFGQALDSILGMSVQLPFMKKIGDEIGLDFDSALAGRTADAAARAVPSITKKKSSDDQK